MWRDELNCDDGICRLCGDLVPDTLEGFDMCEVCLIEYERAWYEREQEKRRPRLTRIRREDFTEQRFPGFTSVRRAMRPVPLT